MPIKLKGSLELSTNIGYRTKLPVLIEFLI